MQRFLLHRFNYSASNLSYHKYPLEAFSRLVVESIKFLMFSYPLPQVFFFSNFHLSATH